MHRGLQGQQQRRPHHMHPLPPGADNWQRGFQLHRRLLHAGTTHFRPQRLQGHRQLRKCPAPVQRRFQRQPHHCPAGVAFGAHLAIAVWLEC